MIEQRIEAVCCNERDGNQASLVSWECDENETNEKVGETDATDDFIWMLLP